MLMQRQFILLEEKRNTQRNDFPLRPAQIGNVIKISHTSNEG